MGTQQPTAGRVMTLPYGYKRGRRGSYPLPGDREGRPYGKDDTEQGERVTKPAAPGTKMQRVIPAAAPRDAPMARTIPSRANG